MILVHGADKKLFDQAIFILKEDAKGITDDMLLTEAKRLVAPEERRSRFATGPLWACGGAGIMALLWLLSVLAF